ncbi:MAG: hypothetical protein ABIQ36_08845, partial [Rhodanobacter sp.]
MNVILVGWRMHFSARIVVFFALPVGGTLKFPYIQRAVRQCKHSITPRRGEIHGKGTESSSQEQA